MNAKFKQAIIRFTIVSVAISVFIRLTDFIAQDFNVQVLLDLKAYTVNFMYAFIIGLVNMLSFAIIYKKYNWYRDVKKIILIGVIGSVVWSTAAFFLARYVHFVVIEGLSHNRFLESQFAATYIFAMLIAFLVTLIFHAIYFYKALQESKLREQAYENAQTSAQYDALKTHLDPHFLFNSLNVLSALIDENPEKAQEFTTHLSRIYRYVLDHKSKELVSLDEELSFVKRYMKLIEMRFENSVKFEINSNENEGYKIIPLSLQLLIENAIKHNKISEENALIISIEINNETLTVSNNINKKQQHQSKRNGIGLENIKHRVSKFTARQVEVIETKKQFSVEIPLIK